MRRGWIVRTERSKRGEESMYGFELIAPLARSLIENVEIIGLKSELYSS